MKKGWGTYEAYRGTTTWKRDNTLSKSLLEEGEKKLKAEYDKLVQDGRLPDGQFESFKAGYGLALLEHK